MKNETNALQKADYTPEIGEYICEQIRSGENLSAICKKRFNGELLPSRHTILRWRKKYPEFGEEFQEALNDYYWLLMDELDYVSKTPFKELYPNEYIREAEAMARKRIQGLTFMLSKMAPRVTDIWQDKTKVEHTGEVKQFVIQSYAVVEEEKESQEECVH